MAEWFEEWFDSAYYHILYSHRDYSEAEVFIRHISGTLGLPQGASVVDIACGKGRHSKVLHELGYDVTGVDLSPQSIEHARAYETTGLLFRTHDMRVPLQASYDAVFNLFTSFGYFDESTNRECIAHFAASLHKGGLLILDFLNIDKAIASMQASTEIQRGDITFRVTKKIEDACIVKDIRFEDKGREYHYTEKVKIIRQEDFRKYCTFASLELVEEYGSYHLEPFDTADSDRYIMVARKS